MPAPDFAYRGQKIANTHLKYDVFVTPSIPVVTTDFAPGEHERPWPPISSTLIYGSRDAVVVDSFISLEQARAQADWIASTGKNLTTIYATHGHGDHFFGASVLLERFPNARFVAASSAIRVMKEQTSPEFVAKFWESRFPNQLPKRLVVAQELSTNVIELEGEKLMVMPLGFTDTAGTTCLHVPSLELIAAGDAAYNGVHPRLMEANQNQKRDEWIFARHGCQKPFPGISLTSRPADTVCVTASTCNERSARTRRVQTRTHPDEVRYSKVPLNSLRSECASELSESQGDRKRVVVGSRDRAMTRGWPAGMGPRAKIQSMLRPESKNELY